MKWKTKQKVYDTEWHLVFAWKPIKTEDGFSVFLEKVYRRYKIHLNGGSYIYKLK